MGHNTKRNLRITTIVIASCVLGACGGGNDVASERGTSALENTEAALTDATTGTAYGSAATSVVASTTTAATIGTTTPSTIAPETTRTVPAPATSQVQRPTTTSQAQSPTTTSQAQSPTTTSTVPAATTTVARERGRAVANGLIDIDGVKHYGPAADVICGRTADMRTKYWITYENGTTETWNSRWIDDGSGYGGVLYDGYGNQLPFLMEFNTSQGDEWIECYLSTYK